MIIGKTTKIIDEAELREWITSKLVEYKQKVTVTCIFSDYFKFIWHNDIVSGKRTRQEFVDYLNTSLIKKHYVGNIRV